MAGEETIWELHTLTVMNSHRQTDRYMNRELALVERRLSVTYDQIDVLLQEGMTGISVELEHASKNYHLINLGRDIELKTIPGDRVSC